MRKLVVLTFLTLDGIMQGPGGPGEDDSGDFKSGGWAVNYFDDAVGEAMNVDMDKPHELVLGRKTYDIMVAYWPHATPEEGGDQMNKPKKYIVSNTLNNVDAWENSVLVQGDAVKEIQRLKEMDGPELQVHGSGNLIQTLLKNNLIDELHLKIFPVAVGNGKRLFGEGIDATAFKLIDSKLTPSGVIIANYALDGALKTGTFALENPPA